MEADQETVFHLTDMTILNAFLIHTSCGSKMMHKNFSEILIHELIIHLQEENVTASGISRGRPSPTASQLSQLEVKYSKHWPSKGKLRQCCVCSLHKQTRSILYFCWKCDGLCVVNCFEKWHTRVNLSHQMTQRVALTVMARGKLYHCTVWTENICRVHTHKCCILVCT